MIERMQMSVSIRLKTIREHLDKTQKEMASLTGISYRTWQNYEDGVNPPGWDACEALVKLGFNANWLLTGKGGIKEMSPSKPFYKQVRDGEVPMAGDGESASYPLMEGFKGASTTNDLPEGFVQVPRYEVAASAGGGALIHSEQIVDHLAFRADWVKMALGVHVSSLALINVTGDSMEPTLSNGDLILIDTSIGSVDDSGVYVLRFDGKLKVKRLHSKADSVDILSDNPRYPTETLRGDLLQGLNVVGRVVWCGRRM
jgi:phage repressor protein C with HTH and peptisase S24 domain